MAKPKVYIDGQQGTTGLRIRDMLEGREDVELMLIPVEERRNPQVRADFLNQADLAILCLPDDAAAEALKLIENSATRVIDTSTERRIAPGWVYGLPELNRQQREAICSAGRVANTGCYPVGFILAVRPLIEAGLLDADVPLTINAVSGYSGGGRKMIEAYQPEEERIPIRLYSLGSVHKHVAEMREYSLTQTPPLFVPSVNDSFCGMLVSTPIPARYLPGNAVEEIYAIWRGCYGEEPFVKAGPPEDESGIWPTGVFMDQSICNFSNRVDLCAFGSEDQGVVLIGRLDNLGKGASGNAVQCMNLMLGFEETAGLR